MPNLVDISHVIYRHPDLDAAEHFYGDFGLRPAGRSDGRLYLRGTGPSPYAHVAEQAATPGFVGVAYQVESIDDLEQAAAAPGAGAVEAIDGPGGGHRVSLADRDGFRIDLVHGIAPAEPLAMRAPLPLNNAIVKRRFGGTQRPAAEPAAIRRLGHVALTVSDVGASVDWLTRTLGLLVSDLLFDGSRDNLVGAFLRFDRGEEWVDHHALAVFKGRGVHLHHASYEVQDFDAAVIGNAWLTRQGWSPMWGIGRHVLGSQIFDYWRDPSGFMVEHYTDGDLCQRDTPMGYHQARPEALYQWGPNVPPTFLD